MRISFNTGLVLLGLLPAATRGADSAAGIAFFEQKVRPVLVEHCYSCHSADAQKTRKLKGGLVLDSKAGLLKGGDSGVIVIPGKPDASLLIKGLRHGDELRMPPKGKLSDRVIADFETWVKMGAPDPRDGKTIEGKGIDVEKGRAFWAFQPPRKTEAPKVMDTAWPKNDVDRFLLAALEAKGLQPVKPASKRDLIRRLSFDLIGLPPTPEEVAAFEKDASPRALETLVERLLKSPQHGERWARYWLDVARFAEDQAHTFGVKPFSQAFRYRDWVIKALNDDLPYDRFVKLQIAGDLMPNAPADPAERLAGLGFLGLGHSYYKNSAAAQASADELDDRIDTLTRGFLGLTVSCRRAVHDHKFDPIPQKDYYSLAGIYNGSDLRPAPLASPAEAERFNQAEGKVKSREGDLQKWLGEKAKKHNRKTIPKDQENKLLSDDEKKQLVALRTELEALKKAMPAKPPEVHVLAGGGKTMHVYIRGNPAQPGEEAAKGFLQVLPWKKETGKEFGRLELGEAIASKDNPLTARVIVNRVWQQHFGRGLVGTPSNFGFLGEKPSHPELLDWLAVRFIEEGWSLRWLHRTIVLSATYQLSSVADARNSEVDADNRWLWRMTRRRLDVEAWRDALLAVSGKLDRTIGGPPQELSMRGNVRRTVYGRISRHRLDPTLNLFDFPDPNVTSATRPVTTVPQQQLFALNSDFMIDRAKELAQRVRTAAQEDRDRIALAFALAFGRAPAAAETSLGLEFLALPSTQDDKLSRWEQYAQALLGTNEFMYVD